jgi:hypothetical protein
LICVFGQVYLVVEYGTQWEKMGTGPVEG